MQQRVVPDRPSGTRELLGEARPSKRWLLWSVGWGVAAIALWLPLLSLDIYWNLISWHLKWDGTVLILMAWVVVALAFIRLVALLSHDRLSRSVGLVLCTLLLALGLYSLPAEPLSAEMFGRVTSSPGWYRGARAVIMSLPLVLWLWALRSDRQKSSRQTGAR